VPLVFGNLPRLSDYTTGSFLAANFCLSFCSKNESDQLTPVALVW
jgi:hypothetical protein